MWQAGSAEKMWHYEQCTNKQVCYGTILVFFRDQIYCFESQHWHFFFCCTSCVLTNTTLNCAVTHVTRFKTYLCCTDIARNVSDTEISVVFTVFVYWHSDWKGPCLNVSYNRHVKLIGEPTDLMLDNTILKINRQCMTHVLERHQVWGSFYPHRAPQKLKSVRRCCWGEWSTVATNLGLILAAAQGHNSVFCTTFL